MPLALPKASDLRAALPRLPGRSRPEPPTMPEGYTTARRRSGGGYRWLIRTAAGVVVLSGLLTIGGNIADRFAGPPAATTTGPAGVDHAVARQLAATFTADYFTYSDEEPDAAEATLARWTGQDSFAGWSGPGQLSADVVTPGSVTDVDADRVIVQTTARVDADTRDSAGTFVDVDKRWLTLDVALTRDEEGQLTVTGAALTGDLPQAILPSGREADAELSRATEQLASDTFAALGSGDLDYITAPGARLSGLADEATASAVTNWRVDQDRSDGADRTGHADVTWQLTGTDLTVTQQYALRLTNDDGRWLVAATGTYLED